MTKGWQSFRCHWQHDQSGCMVSEIPAIVTPEDKTPGLHVYLMSLRVANIFEVAPLDPLAGPAELCSRSHYRSSSHAR